ncbi:MAG TPA: tetratricopeptide repeat protein [Thermoanaerobaculia bacterium]|nr:tetratricopeptide repeat protein [Thermoanaerobaculia bacterium]
MAEPPSSDYRLEHLQERWAREPTSRVFLQLAEEYRRRGDHRQAAEVLQQGLALQPRYAAARVALGRCRLEMEQPDAAREVLERVVAEDPTQIVANKLLAEAYLRLGDSLGAIEVIDRCRLLSVPEEELQELETRVSGLIGRGDRSGWEAAGGAAGAGSDAEGFDEDDLFDEPTASLRQEELVGEAAATEAAGPGQVFRLPAVRLPPVALPGRKGEANGRRLHGGGSDPWLALDDPGRRQRHLESLTAEGIFVASPPAEELPEGPGVVPLDAEVAAAVAAPAAAAAEEPSPAAAREAEELPTATLGQLYLRQGYLAEAEAIFAQVLQREPGNRAAREGLEAVRRRPREPVTAAGLLRREDAEVRGVTARKIVVLERYRQLLRQGAGSDVPRTTE